jgi:hypothetical protein
MVLDYYPLVAKRFVPTRYGAGFGMFDQYLDRYWARLRVLVELN